MTDYVGNLDPIPLGAERSCVEQPHAPPQHTCYEREKGTHLKTSSNPSSRRLKR